MTASEVERILDRLNDLEASIGVLDNSITSLRKYIMGDIKNGDETIGLAERVRRIEKWIETRSWVERAFIGVFIVETAAFVIVLAKIALTYAN